MNWYHIGYAPSQKIDGITFRGGYAFVDAYTCHNFATPHEAPYSYGVFIINGPIKHFEYEEGSGRWSDYDDRLRQQYRDNWTRAESANILPKGWNRWKTSSLNKISEFLSIVYGHKVKCLQVLEGCNVGNGYSYNVFTCVKDEEV